MMRALWGWACAIQRMGAGLLFAAALLGGAVRMRAGCRAMADARGAGGAALNYTGTVVYQSGDVSRRFDSRI